MNYPELILLGATAGFTIFLGLPVIALGASEKLKGFLNAVAVGVLLFLVVDVFSNAWNETSAAAEGAASGISSVTMAAADLILMFGGLAVGLIGLVYFERKFMKGPEGATPAKISMMIALGIGAHNLSEGLAIGQSYASGAIGLAVVLVVGFAAHNATEGFGIVAPLTVARERPRLGFLAKVLSIGGTPTLLGTLAGSVAYSPQAFIFFLTLAGGALIYVTMLMFNTGRRQYSNELMMVGIFIGLSAGFLTDLIVSLGGA